MDWFFGFRNLSDPTSFFPNFAVDSEDFLAIHPEYILAGDDRQRFLADRRGCIIGPATASRFGWKIGDTFQLVSAIQAVQHRPACTSSWSAGSTRPILSGTRAPTAR